MTVLYPRERVKEVLQPLSLATAHRIVLKPYLSDPLTARRSKSRFCDGRTYAVLYAAGDFATAFAEVVVRDRLVQRDRRFVPFGDITARGWVEFSSNDVPLQMVDLRESGCLILGAPTDTAHARNQAAGRALGRALYEQHADIDGIWYQSRLTGGDCAAELEEIAQSVDGLVHEGVGTRRLIELPWCSELAERLMRDHRVSGFLPVKAIPVQCTLFAKSTENNWLVSLHQDLSTPVAERVHSPGCQGWSEKEGGLFVQPPTSVLEGVMALRLHLDDCNERNGALRVVPGSHRLGRLTAEEVSRTKDWRGEVIVQVARGGAMIMKPLLLHASSKASIGGMRRVLHFVFGATELPGGLRWPATKAVAC